MILRFSCVIFLLLPLAIDSIVDGKHIEVLEEPGYVDSTGYFKNQLNITVSTEWNVSP